MCTVHQDQAVHGGLDAVVDHDAPRDGPCAVLPPVQAPAGRLPAGRQPRYVVCRITQGCFERCRYMMDSIIVIISIYKGPFFRDQPPSAFIDAYTHHKMYVETPAHTHTHTYVYIFIYLQYNDPTLQSMNAPYQKQKQSSDWYVNLKTYHYFKLAFHSC